MRLSDHLKHLGFSSADAKRAMRSGRVRLHGIPTADAGREIQPFQVEVLTEGPKLTPGRDLVVVHRDEHFVVVWKPAGMLSVQAGKAGGHLNVVGLVRKLTGGEAFPVHRLDQDTSGLMMVARTVSAQTALKAQLEVHSVERAYVALVLGRPPKSKWTVSTTSWKTAVTVCGSITAPIHHSAGETHSQPRRVGKRANLVEARLETGRTHQVRIHLSEAGLPILGDTRYGTPAAQRMAPRLALHAAVLGVDHPVTGERLRFTCGLPDDIEQARRGLIHAHSNPVQKRKKSKVPKKRRR